MIERGIAQKIEEAKTQGWRQRALSKFLATSFNLAKACGLTDIAREATQIPLDKEERIWSAQAEKLINLGFHVELDMSEDAYHSSIPSFQPQPLKYKGRFNHAFLIDPRVSLQRQMAMHKVIAGNGITEADLTRLSMNEALKPYIPKEPYQLWVNIELREYEKAWKARELKLRSVEEFTYDERGLTAIEGLAILREAKNILYGGFPNFHQDGLLLLDSGFGESGVLTLKPVGDIRLPGEVAVLAVHSAGKYTSSYNLASCAKLSKR